MSSAAVATLEGARLREMFAAAAGHLESQAAAINAINVYPVPDGDTGSNMSATLREAVHATASLPGSATAAEVAAAIAHGALYGARGNSGVILSQALRGFADGLAGAGALDAGRLAAALRLAATRAYGAVAEPREGTMLTVLRAAGEGASAAQSAGAGFGETLAAAVRAAEQAEAVTIDQLPQLREAGVTDSGGEGICVILRALHASLAGVPLPVAPPAAAVPDLHALEHGGYGHCTEFLVERGEAAPTVEAVRAWLVDGGHQSIVVVGDEELVRVHVHALDPDAVLRGAEAFGRLRRIKVDDMDLQADRFAATGSGATARVAVLALSPGKGLDAVFRDLGAHVFRLELVKPAAGELARAADALRTPDVILLPNHENVTWAADQAVGLASCTLHVVHSVTVPQGIAATLAFDAAHPVDQLTASMAEVMESVHTVEVTRAAASRTVEGVDVREGQWIALVDTRLVAAADDAHRALALGLDCANAATAELVTVYTGEGHEADADSVRDVIEGAYPQLTIEVIEGGQPLYAFIASVE